MRNRTDDGYTLTEMLVVIGIIGLLAAVLTPLLIGQMGRARAKAARLQVENVAASVEMFRSDVGRYPTEEEGFTVLTAAPADADNWLGPYQKSAESLRDPWGRELIYEPETVERPPRVVSLGADGVEGGRGPAADLMAP